MNASDHVYTAKGHYTISVLVTDDDGGTGEASIDLTAGIANDARLVGPIAGVNVYLAREQPVVPPGRPSVPAGAGLVLPGRPDEAIPLEPAERGVDGAAGQPRAVDDVDIDGKKKSIEDK